MSDQLPAPQQKAIRFSRDDLPKRGEWFHVTYQPSDEKAPQETELMCVEHVASNHVVFARSHPGGGRWHVRMRFRNLMEDTKPAPNWRELIQGEIDAKQKELHEAVKALADCVRSADLLPENVEATPSLLPSRTRRSPAESKKALIKLRDKSLPEAQKQIEQITKELVALNKDTCLPMLAECDVMLKTKEKIEDRLFVLEIYAGLGEHATQIAEGKPPEPSTPITVRQMLRYMDEETLINYEYGGMDYTDLKDFDAWLAKPENYGRILPEPRCVVAFKVRRHPKDYGRPESLAHAFAQMEWHNKNMKTYLAIRNGENVWRLATDIEFEPRLLPYRDEFHRPFTHKEWWEREKEPETITPEDFLYDDKVEERQKLIFKYNRVLFLIQGLLDRSKVFRPHPPINLGDAAAVQEFVRLNYDEELGLPSANPPKWEEYRARLNKSIKPGSWVWAKWEDEEYDSWERPGHRYKTVKYRKIVEVTQVKKDRSAVRVSWPWEDREGYEFPTGWGRGYGAWGTWPVNRKHHRWVPIGDVLHCDAYAPGDYKQFLCDAYLKGEYLRWADPLLGAEGWHQKKAKEQTEAKRKK